MRWMIVAAVVIIVSGAAVAFRRMERPPALRATTDTTEFGRRHDPRSRTEAATFAAGCFWKLERAMRGVGGVVSTTAGYTGGPAADGEVNHYTVSTGRTGHAEAVRVTFDPTRVSYETLLDVFFSSHDPARFAREDGEPSPPGRSAVFYHSAEQRAAAETTVSRLNAARPAGARPVPTTVEPATTFYRAEADHQQYLEKHGRGSCPL